MALFDKLQRTVVKLTRPVMEDEQAHSSVAENNNEELNYLRDFQESVISLANEVYGCSEPKEIALCTLKKACEFYDADWCGVFDVDLMLNLWMPFWWYDREEGWEAKLLIYRQYGITGEFHRFLDALENNLHLFMADIEEVKNISTEEYNLYSQSLVKSFLAVPYNKREKGFLFLRNPQKNCDRPEFLQVVANILVQEINEQKLLDCMKSDACPECRENGSGLIINLFGGLSICGERGKMTEAEMKSTLCAKMLVLLLMNRHRGMSAREISEHLWSDKDYDNPTGNLRSLLFRCRAALHLITDAELIITTPTGYRINPDLNIKTDYEEFERICENRDALTDRDSKISELGKAVKLYQGKLFPIGSSEHWLMPHNSRYSIMYLPVLDELMELLHSEKNYHLMYEYAMQAISVEPDSPITIYWLIVALRKHGAVDMAKKQLEFAKLRLLEEEYKELEERLISE